MTIDVLPVAARELAKAMAWYDSQRFGLGRDLIDEVHAAIDRMRPIQQAGRKSSAIIVASRSSDFRTRSFFASTKSETES